MQISVPNDVLIPEVRRLLDNGDEVVLKTKGNSMLPTIVGDRDSVRLVKISFDIVHEGDIVLAEVGERRYVLHRVIRKSCDRLVLRGDGNLTGTEVCLPEKLIGVAIAVITPSGKEKKPGKAKLWRTLNPFARRCVLAVYRRTILKLYKRSEL